jgi:hypothetical protein
LGRLISERMENKDHRWGVRDVERRARERGESLNKTTVSELRREMTPTITRANVYGLAAGLGVTPLTVALAALESWGIETRPIEVTDSLATIAIDPTLSDRDRRQLRALITDMRADQGENDGMVDTTQSRAQSEALRAQEVSVRPAARQDSEDWAVGWSSSEEDPGVGGDEDGEKGEQLPRR